MELFSNVSTRKSYEPIETFIKFCTLSEIAVILFFIKNDEFLYFLNNLRIKT